MRGMSDGNRYSVLMDSGRVYSVTIEREVIENIGSERWLHVEDSGIYLNIAHIESISEIEKKHGKYWKEEE